MQLLFPFAIDPPPKPPPTPVKYIQWRFLPPRPIMYTPPYKGWGECPVCGEGRTTWDIHGHRTYMCGYPTPPDENNKKTKPTPCEGGRYDVWSAEVESLWPDFSDLLKDVN